jgi:hypothetical protein
MHCVPVCLAVTGQLHAADLDSNVTSLTGTSSVLLYILEKA